MKTRKHAIVLAAFSLFLLIFASSVLPAPLPKIRVAADGRTFETVDDKPFVPFGVSYFRPGQGWAPKLWQRFDADRFREDCKLMRSAGVNCLRVFLAYGSFMPEKGKLDEESLKKFDAFLEIAEEHGMYVTPTGLDTWEGPGCWKNADYPEYLSHNRYISEEIMEQTNLFWRVFVTRYKGRGALFAYELKNEPRIHWNVPGMKVPWNHWLEKEYGTVEKLAESWEVPVDDLKWKNIGIPPGDNSVEGRRILDYQRFREKIADRWTKRQVETIKQADPDALVTIGYMQSFVPLVLGRFNSYDAFRPSRQAPMLDFISFHYYPLGYDGFYSYQDTITDRALAGLECLARECARHGKPVVLGEFGWYGGGTLKNTPGRPPATEEQQAEWNKAVIRTTEGLVCGWLHWGFFDMPEAVVATELMGPYTVDGRPKVWGKEFKILADELSGKRIPPGKQGDRPEIEEVWDKMISERNVRRPFFERYLKACREDAGR